MRSPPLLCRRLSKAGCLLAGFLSLWMVPLGLAAEDDEGGSGWAKVVNQPDLQIFYRKRPGSDVKELRAVGRVDAPNWVVKNVIDDAENYPRFMPYIRETRVLARDPARHTLIAYTKLTPPLVGPRDFTLRVFDEPRRAADGSGPIYVSRWELANELGPAESPGVTRVKVNIGSWVLEPIDEGKATRATYMLHTDGGGLPAFVVNTANKRSVAELFAAVRKTAQEPKYRASRPREP